MRHRSLTLLGFLLVLPFGCSGKSESDKTESKKSESTAAKPESKESSTNIAANNKTNSKTNNKTNEIAANNSSNNASTNTTTNNSSNNASTNNSSNNASSADVSGAFALVPSGTTAMWSVTPSSLMASSFIQAIPKEDDFIRGMAEMKKDVGFDLTGVSRITVALWPGEGHVVPDLSKLAPGGGPGGPGGFDRGDSKFDEKFEEKGDFDECNAVAFQPGGPGGGLEQLIMGLLPKFDGALYVQLNQDLDLQKLRDSFPPLMGMQESDVDGRKVLVSPVIDLAGGVALHQPDPRNLIITFKDDLSEIFADAGSGPMVTAAKTQGANADAMLLLDFGPFQNLIQMAAGFAAGQVPGAGELLPQLAGVSLFADVNDGVNVDMMIDAKDEKTIATIKSAFDENYQGAAAQVGMAAENAPPGTSDETKALIGKLANEVYESAKGEAKGKRFHLTLRVPPTAADVIKKIDEEHKVRRDDAARKFKEDFKKFDEKEFDKK